MNVKLLRMARKLWDVDFAPPQINRANMLKWARSAHNLGDRWLLAKYVQRRAQPF